MQGFNIIKKSSVKKSFRNDSVKGIFDLKLTEIKETFTGEIKLPDDWQIGLIYGNSGTGKTTIAKQVFKSYYINSYTYGIKSIIDEMPKEKTVNEIIRMFNSVGFSSPPCWLKPYKVLSNGEKMRVDLARALLTDKKIIVFDEYTSVVDRTIAKIGSRAVQNAIKKTNKKFIAVSCHSDIIDWLQPDWIFDTNTMKNRNIRGLLRQPKIKIEIKREKGKWDLFRKYHYLNHDINNSGHEYVGYIDNKEVCFMSVLHLPHSKSKNLKKIHRLVVLPDYQGIGIGNRFTNYIAKKYIDNNFRFTIVTSNPALIHTFKRQKNWKLKSKTHKAPHSGVLKSRGVGNLGGSTNRITTSWEFN